MAWRWMYWQAVFYSASRQSDHDWIVVSPISPFTLAWALARYNNISWKGVFAGAVGKSTAVFVDKIQAERKNLGPKNEQPLILGI